MPLLPPQRLKGVQLADGDIESSQLKALLRHVAGDATSGVPDAHGIPLYSQPVMRPYMCAVPTFDRDLSPHEFQQHGGCGTNDDWGWGLRP